ncbi:MFS transporter [Nostoc sp. 'Peltigera malacea cyanobiont' DB3992]|uniref:MFS transporter n=1 Tax=Nostoc sp. 'Peltigera malacea cyanobiont' DB3992 TaxID=1206980 RepID=UPI000C0417E8|nr:MFS transporter [Nostoc sp. 'Peltigera malacea cyanobiont' DB3992]PHM07488.1 MFS transporter [Nostoc sp. 'Peltigera malacea cyanobiont' DB3992]
MVQPQEDDISVEASSLPPVPIQEISEDRTLTETVLFPTPKLFLKISKPEIRQSLRTLTYESVLAAVLYSIIGGALLSNFLLELGAGPVEIGLLAAIPQMVNLLQPLGAYLVNRSTSFRWYFMCIFIPSRLLWLILLPAIWLVTSSHITGHQVIQLTLAILLVANIIEAFGRAPWLGWSAVLVPQRLRGRYFGFRNSILGLTNLIGVPLLGLAVSAWPGGTLQGYGIVLVIGIVLGLISVGCQFWMTDINPQLLKVGDSDTSQPQTQGIDFSFLKDANFLKFVLYLSIWCFAVNISAPFFNLYMLDNLDIDISVVTIYHGLGTGANMLMLLLWGKLADRIGNRPLLLLVGVLVAVTPLLWLLVGSDQISFWIWLPLLHILAGATWAAIDLCTNNLMMGIAPLRYQSSYFAIAGAIAGITGAMGITVGSFLASLPGVAGLLELFVLSGLLRMAALVPLVFVQEQRSVPLGQLMQVLFPIKQSTDLIEAE